MKRAKFLTPIITAFQADGGLDHEGNMRLWDHVINGGVDGIVLLGSAGEFCSMSLEQRKELVQLAAKHIGNRAELIVGTGGMDAQETIAFSNFSLEAGASAVMVISPYYFSLTDENVERFYDCVAPAVKGDIYLYSYPDRTGYDITPTATVNLLRRHKNIVGYKDSVSDFSHTRKLLATVSEEFPDFIVYSGFDENMVHNLLCGGSGCIGGLSNIYPEVFAGWTTAINSGDIQAMSKYQKLTDKLMDIYTVGNPFMPVVRKALQLRGVELEEYCTHPIGPVSEAQAKEIQDIINAADAYIKRELSVVEAK